MSNMWPILTQSSLDILNLRFGFYSPPDAMVQEFWGDQIDLAASEDFGKLILHAECQSVVFPCLLYLLNG
jgi:hypothetical protein